MGSLKNRMTWWIGDTYVVIIKETPLSWISKVIKKILQSFSKEKKASFPNLIVSKPIKITLAHDAEGFFATNNQFQIISQGITRHEAIRNFCGEVIRHKKNSGYGAALSSLFKYARKLGADVLVTLDADGQHDANEIPNLLKPLSLLNIGLVRC